MRTQKNLQIKINQVNQILKMTMNFIKNLVIMSTNQRLLVVESRLDMEEAFQNLRKFKLIKKNRSVVEVSYKKRKTLESPAQLVM